MKLTVYLSYAISLIFIVMGIVILVVPLEGTYLERNETTKIIFGILLIMYGVFRGFKGYLLTKKKPEDGNDSNF